MGELYGFMIVSYGPSGRVTRVRLEGSAGAKEVPGTPSPPLSLPTNFFPISEQKLDQFLLIQTPMPTPTTQLTYHHVRGGQWKDTRRRAYPAAPSTSTASCEASRCRPRSISDIPIVAERAMYFDFMGSGMTGGHTSTSATAKRTQWYLAKGSVSGGFNS